MLLGVHLAPDHLLGNRQHERGELRRSPRRRHAGGPRRSPARRWPPGARTRAGPGSAPRRAPARPSCSPGPRSRGPGPGPRRGSPGAGRATRPPRPCRVGLPRARLQICSWRSSMRPVDRRQDELADDAQQDTGRRRARRSTSRWGSRKLLVANIAVGLVGRGHRVAEPRGDGATSCTGTKTKSAVKARLMKYMASTRPTVRNMYGGQSASGLGLTGHAGDGLAAGQAVADGRADGAAAHEQAAADHCARQLIAWSVDADLPSVMLLFRVCGDRGGLGTAGVFTVGSVRLGLGLVAMSK